MSYQEALERIPTQLQKIVNALKEAGNEGVTNYELSRICLKYDSRISDLRRKGFIIDVKAEEGKKGVFRYFLIKRPSKDYFFPNATEETLQDLEKNLGYGYANYLEKYFDKKGFKVARKHGWYKEHTIN